MIKRDKTVARVNASVVEPLSEANMAMRGMRLLALSLIKLFIDFPFLETKAYPSSWIFA